MPGSPQFSPHFENGENSEKLGRTGDKLGRIRSLVSEGWSLRLKKRKGTLYVSARKAVDGKRKEIYVCKVTEDELPLVLPILKLGRKRRGRKSRSRRSSGYRSSTITSSSRGSAESRRVTPAGGGVGGSSHLLPTSGLPRSKGAPQPISGPVSGSVGPGSASGDGQNRPRGDSVQGSYKNGGPRELMVHRLVLKFVRPWVSPLYLSSFGARWVERSKQRVFKLRLGRHRVLTVQVNANGTAQIYLEASEAPLTVEEFIGFSSFYLLELFSRLTGRAVSLSDFIVLAAPEFNVDLPGQNLLEGLGKSLTLERYAEGVIRIYRKGFATTMPDGGTRVEFRAEGLSGRSLRDVVDSVVAQVELPRLVHDLRKELELVKSGITQLQTSRGALVEAVAAKLANLLDLFFRRLEARLQQWFREVIDKVVEAVEGYIDALRKRVEELEAENRRLREELRKASGSSLSASGERQNLELGILVAASDRMRDLYARLLELARPTDSRPALVKINEAQGWVAFSDDLWRYIMRRLPDGSRRGLDREILEKVKAHEGPEVEELLLLIQRRGRVSIQEALELLSRWDRGGGA